MKNNFRRFLSAVLSVSVTAGSLAFAEASAQNSFTDVIQSGVINTYNDSQADMFADFRKGEAPEFFASDGWSNGSCFDCVWTKNNTSFKDNALNLTIDKDYSGQYNYTGAEYRTTDFYH
ncbi:MAG: hypothetical protein PUA51_02175, partial [Oscillospiraceae bacterium]|nr:hypothetical protein [Oscillospiraceae bacterium]